MSHNIIPLLFDYIVKKCHIDTKISKIIQHAKKKLCQILMVHSQAIKNNLLHEPEGHFTGQMWGIFSFLNAIATC